jgi:hypothetical protein
VSQPILHIEHAGVRQCPDHQSCMRFAVSGARMWSGTSARIPLRCAAPLGGSTSPAWLTASATLKVELAHSCTSCQCLDEKQDVLDKVQP